jgi:membrane complex biogenesis BtpA family protein
MGFRMINAFFLLSLQIKINGMNSKVFEKAKPIIGVLQLLPLPGSTGWKGKIHPVIARAEQEATALASGGVDAILVENTFDAPYVSDRMDPAGAIAMGLIIRRIMHFTHLPIGVSVLRNDPETALAIAMNVGAKFIRTSLLTGAAICETGLLQGKYRDLIAYRQRLQVEGIALFADISLEKTVPLVGAQAGSAITLKVLAQQALHPGMADGVILTDTHLSPEAIAGLRQELDAPVFYDFSHPLAEVNPYSQAADGLIVSSAIKKPSGMPPDAPPTVDLTKVEELVAVTEMLRSQAATLA